jgi:hypothetical protein
LVEPFALIVQRDLAFVMTGTTPKRREQPARTTTEKGHFHQKIRVSNE